MQFSLVLYAMEIIVSVYCVYCIYIFISLCFYKSIFFHKFVAERGQIFSILADFMAHFLFLKERFEISLKIKDSWREHTHAPLLFLCSPSFLLHSHVEDTIVTFWALSQFPIISQANYFLFLS